MNLRLEAPHLTARGRLFGDGMAADDPPHDRVEAEPVGIVHVVVAAKASRNKTDWRNWPTMPCRPFMPVRLSARTSPTISVSSTEASSSSIGEQTGVSSDLGPVELKLQTAVKIDPKADVVVVFTPVFRFTNRIEQPDVWPTISNSERR